MKSVQLFFSVIACCVLCVSVSHAGLNITDSQHQAFAKTFDDTLAGGFSDNAATPVNGSITTQQTSSLGPAGANGEYAYKYTTANTVSISGNSANLNISASVDLSALSNAATAAKSEEGVGAFLDFKITGQNYFATLDFTSLLSPTNSVGTSSLSTFSFLLKDGNRVQTLSHSIDNDGTVKKFSDLPLPTKLLLTPGDYHLFVGLNGLRSGPYNLPNLSMSGTASLALTAVPEPATLILWSCVGAFGAPKLRSYLKRRNSIKA